MQFYLTTTYNTAKEQQHTTCCIHRTLSGDGLYIISYVLRQRRLTGGKTSLKQSFRRRSADRAGGHP